MKPFPEDPKFTPGEKGFDDKDKNGRPYDLLGRKPVGQRLTDLLDRVEQPLVVALDGGWGSGKSHFLKLWTGAHARELGGKAKIIYFDAFEHDYLDDPLISLVARLATKEAEITWGKKAVKAVKRAALPLARLGLRVGAAAATAGATEIAGPVADAIVTKTGEATDASIDAFWKRETGRIAAMQQFRDALTALTRNGEAPQKIVFIIDELDRCRPDYALTMLEIVKHFFSVPSVHFVLGTNMGALENSVRARYGINANATEYLMKFIHIRMTFQVARDHQGNDKWAAFFDQVSRSMGIGANVTRSLRENLSIYSQGSQVSLRDVQRILGRIALFPKGFDSTAYAYQRLATSALIMEVLAPIQYQRLRSGKLSIQEFTRLFAIEQSGVDPSSKAHILYHLWRRALLEEPGEETIQVTTKLLGSLDSSFLKHEIELFWVELFDTFQLASSTK